MGTRRRANRLSLIARATRALVGMPEGPRPRTWPDVLGAALLLSLGGSAFIGGLVSHRALGPRWLPVEGVALVIALAGVVSWRFGAPWAAAVLFVAIEAGGSEEDYPTIYSAFPFLAFGLACFVLAVMLPIRASVESVAVTLIATAMGSLALALLVPLTLAIARWARRPRKDGERASRPPSDSDKRP